MPEKENATSGQLVAGTAVSTNGDKAHPHLTTKSGETYPTDPRNGQMLSELQALAEAAKVEPADVLSAKKVAALLPQVATYPVSYTHLTLPTSDLV